MAVVGVFRVREMGAQHKQPSASLLLITATLIILKKLTHDLRITKDVQLGQSLKYGFAIRRLRAVARLQRR